MSVLMVFSHPSPCHCQDLDEVVQVLLHKAGESNAFLRQLVDRCMMAMVTNVSPQRALVALVHGGLT